MESLDSIGSSLAASFEPAANAWVALSASRGIVKAPIDADWQEVPRDALPMQSSLTAAPSGQTMVHILGDHMLMMHSHIGPPGLAAATVGSGSWCP